VESRKNVLEKLLWNVEGNRFGSKNRIFLPCGESVGESTTECETDF
jgi:hypothetical protein